MMTSNILQQYKHETLELAESLHSEEILTWILKQGYFPEQYVLPPCFNVKTIRDIKKGTIYNVTKKGSNFRPTRTSCIDIGYPKTELTDRIFSIIHPKIHFDISYVIAHNWKTILKALIPPDSDIVSYSFPIPLTKHYHGRVGNLRGGRMVYEFIEMTDDHLTSIAYKYKFVVNADIKNFYPSIYTHSIAWALHTKEVLRAKNNKQQFKLIGNVLDKLFQNANDGRTNGIPIGPVVSDIIAEIIASAVDVEVTKLLRDENINFEATRFKDDYRFLVHDEHSAKRCIKLLHKALQKFNLQINDEKTKILNLPQGLFREWVSHYHAANPAYKDNYSWKEFRELYLSVIAINEKYPNTGVIDKFLSDITSEEGDLKVGINNNVELVFSMLLMLGNLKIKTFPKVIGIIENVHRKFLGELYTNNIVEHLTSYLDTLFKDKDRNHFLIMWIYYFLKSNHIGLNLIRDHEDTHPIIKAITQDGGTLFSEQEDFTLFEDCHTSGQRTTLYEHLNIFNREQSEESTVEKTEDPF